MLRSEQIVRFEAETGVALPVDFRRFVLELGNGGAGPTYGWQAFNADDADFRHAIWQGPFLPPQSDDDENDELRGCITLSHHGCGMFDFLVVAGPERGHVWLSDDSGSLYPLPGPEWDSMKDLPTERRYTVWRQRLRNPTNVSRISFIDYMEQWLDDVLASTSR